MGFFKKPIPPLKAYYWAERPNFGDRMAPLLLERFAGIPSVEWDTISRSLIASVGSILEHIPPLWDGYILGSGRLFEDSRLLLSTKTATIYALRGPLSAKGLKGDYALGDPGLLTDELVGYQEKAWDLGIVPHWLDKELVPRFRKVVKPPHTVLAINPADDPLTVLRQIGSCRRIVTSSLHGMIASDAFTIPRRVELCPRLLKEGGTFKFRDYSASIASEFKPGVMMEPSRARVEDRRFEIGEAYRSLGEDLRNRRMC
jgi:hypothetical protein